jgi:hypothetical protein
MIEIFQLLDGKIQARKEIFDKIGFYQQLGMERKPKEEEKWGFRRTSE